MNFYPLTTYSCGMVFALKWDVNEKSNQFLRWLDRFLLVIIIVLLCFCWRDLRDLTRRSVAHTEPEVELSSASTQEETEPLPSQVLVESHRTYTFSPGRASVTQARVSRIARTTLSDSGWDGLPVSQAADMRERDGLYDIALALSREVDEKTVHVSRTGNILSLSVNATGNPYEKYVKQFYIPCAPSDIGAVESSVTNGVIHIRIHRSAE